MFETKGFSGLLLNGAEWILKFIYVHFLWMIFTILGLGLFGFMPATAAVFSIIRKWLMKESDIAIFPHFYNVYKSVWKTSNIIGLALFLIGSFLFIDFKISQELLKFVPIHFFILFLLFIFIITCLFIFPTLAHYNLKPLQYIKQSLLLALAQPIYIIPMLLWLLCTYYIYIYAPAIYFFMGATLVAFPIMWLSFQAFNKVERKKNSVSRNNGHMMPVD